MKFASHVMCPPERSESQSRWQACTHSRRMRLAPISYLLSFWAAIACRVGASNHDSALQPGGHSNNWAVLVCTSRYWFNYRHIANTLSMYRTVKRRAAPLLAVSKPAFPFLLVCCSPPPPPPPRRLYSDASLPSAQAWHPRQSHHSDARRRYGLQPPQPFPRPGAMSYSAWAASPLCKDLPASNFRRMAPECDSQRKRSLVGSRSNEQFRALEFRGLAKVCMAEADSMLPQATSVPGKHNTRCISTVYGWADLQQRGPPTEPVQRRHRGGLSRPGRQRRDGAGPAYGPSRGRCAIVKASPLRQRLQCAGEVLN